MRVPAFITSQMVDKDGFLTREWQILFQQLFQQMQINLSDEGIKAPPQSASNILLLNTAQSTGNIVYDSTNDLFKGNVAGTFKTFTLT